MWLYIAYICIYIFHTCNSLQISLFSHMTVDLVSNHLVGLDSGKVCRHLDKSVLKKDVNTHFLQEYL